MSPVTAAVVMQTSGSSGKTGENEASKSTGDVPRTEAKAGCRLGSYPGVRITGRDVDDPHSKLRSLQSPGSGCRCV